MIIGPHREPVGRDRELSELMTWAHEGLGHGGLGHGGLGHGGSGRDGRGGVLVLSGDAGMGKTTVLTTFAQRVEGEGVLVGVGHCVDLGGSPLPYLPFVEAFDRLRAADRARVEPVLEQRPALARLLNHQGPDHARTGTQIELFEAVRGALADLAADTGVLIWIEDVHWADQSSLDLISYLLTRGFEAPVLLTVSYRTDDLHRRHPLRRVLTQWSRLPARRLDLRPLDPASVRSLVTGLDGAPSDPELIRGVVERAEGNAFYAEELATAAGEASGGLPTDLSDLLLFRINGLGEDARAVVRAAAMAGRRVDHDVLTDVVDLSTDRLDAALRESLDAQLLQTEASGYVFRHALLAEAVAADLLPGERVRLHAGYVRALTAHQGAPSDLARHALGAGADDVALAASVAAGRNAIMVGGPEEALAHFEAALDLLDRGHADAAALPDGIDEVDLARRASIAAQAAGLQQRAIGLIRDRLDRLAGDADPLIRGRLLEAMAAAVILSDYEDPLPYSAEALALIPDTPSVERARVLKTHAAAMSGRGRHAEALRWAEEAHRLARQLGEPSLAADAATLVARLGDWLGENGSAVAELEAVIAESRTRNDPTELRARYLLGMVSYEVGDLDRALELFGSAAERAAELGRPWAPYGIDGRSMAAITHYVRGEWEEVLALTAIGDAQIPGLAAAGLRVAAMEVHAGRGDAEATAVDAEAVQPWWRGDGVIAVLSVAAGIDARGDVGDIDGAVALHADGVRFVTGAWAEPYFGARVRFSALLLGQLATAVGRTPDDAGRWRNLGDELADAAERAFEHAQVQRQGPEALAWLARARAERARLAWLSGDTPAGPELVAAWRASVDGFSTFAHRFERARSQTRLAAAVVAADPGGLTEAKTLAAEARATAAELGARPLLAELDEIAPAPRDRRGAGPDVLTPRETEVLALVADGLSNAEVGRRLVISTKTASVHVSNILAKLGAASRTQAAAVARRRGLLP